MSVPDASEKIRAFIAIRVDAEVERAIDALIMQLRSHNDGIRWVSSANLHLTLKFLGPDVPMENIRRLEPELRTIAADAIAFDLEAVGVGGFPDLRHPHVLWIGLRGDALRDLASRVDDAAARYGFAREQRAFNGHLTIGRVKRPRLHSHTRAGLEEAKNREFGTSTIREMTLYRSITAASGPTYEALSRFQFKSTA
jgi:RNA 2',3'-cyclic 3'-phosphodiesterase